MKKLFLLAFLCTPLFTQVITKNNLDSAIRSLDVRTVEHIVAKEKFSQREYNRYLDLAEEVVRSRESWVAKIYPMYDSATPYEGLSFKRLLPELFVGKMALNAGLFYTTMFMQASFAERGRRYDKKTPWALSAIASFLVVGKVLYDLRNRFVADKTYKEILRKKYEDAVTIKQLIYAANIVEA